MAKKVYRYVDYHMMAPAQFDELLFSPFQQALGAQAWDRISTQLRYYDYYNGKQHIHPDTGALVRADELPRPPGLDYDPSRFTTNYFKTFITKKARWQMGGKHGITVKPEQIDPQTDVLAKGYEPSPAQEAENERAKRLEKLIYRLWKDNRMREKLIEAAKDRMVAGRVAVKIMYSERTGKMRWIFRPDTEVIPVFSDDDFEELIACHFVTYEESQERGEPDNIRKQTFFMENARCWIEEAVYTQDLEVVRVIQEPTNLGIDFLPVELIPVSELSGEGAGTSELESMIQLTDVLNKMNEDAVDALKFDMFPMTAFLNVPPGTSDNVEIAPGSMLEIAGAGIQGTASPDIRKVESGFTWTTALNDQYMRIKSALHEVTSVPNIIPQDLNFGGLNGDALHVLFHSIIQDTQEHWIVWESRLKSLHEKTVRYLQVLDKKGVATSYEEFEVSTLGTEIEHDIDFVLPLPDDRKELVELLAMEVGSGFESKKGAIERLGVENVSDKLKEIESETQRRRTRGTDPYESA